VGGQSLMSSNQYLSYFLEDDEELKKLRFMMMYIYECGEMLIGEDYNQRALDVCRRISETSCPIQR